MYRCRIIASLIGAVVDRKLRAVCQQPRSSESLLSDWNAVFESALIL
jgi:hypothetical protein